MKKNDLLKLAGIFVLIAILLSWICSSATFSSGELVTQSINRAGLFDLSTYSLLGFYYFPTLFIFLFIVAGFYGFLGKTVAYKTLTDNIAKKLEGKEKIFIAVITLLIAMFTGVSTDHFILVAFIPFVISILSKLKVDKITGLVSTFGGVLIGIVGSTYGTKVAGIFADQNFGIGIGYGSNLVPVVIAFVLAYVLLLTFTFIRMNKIANDKNVALLEDPFASTVEVTKKKGKNVVVNTLPLVITLVITFVLLILGFIGWKAAFSVSIFDTTYTWLTEATLFGQPVFSYILGSSFVAFGAWDLFSACAIIVIASFVIKFLYHISFDDMIEGYGEGFIRIGKTIVVLLVIYTVLVLSIVYSVIPGIINWFLNIFGTNIFTLFISGLFASLFTVDMQYTVSMIGSIVASFANVKLAALAIQSAYGVVSFIAPTSAILVLGLSMLDIKYKDYLKFIWKFLLALIVALVAILAILMYL